MTSRLGPCVKTARYRTREAAETALAELQARGRGEAAVYRCRKCRGGFHLSSQDRWAHLEVDCPTCGAGVGEPCRVWAKGSRAEAVIVGTRPTHRTRSAVQTQNQPTPGGMG